MKYLLCLLFSAQAFASASFSGEIHELKDGVWEGTNKKCSIRILKASTKVLPFDPWERVIYKIEVKGFKGMKNIDVKGTTEGFDYGAKDPHKYFVSTPVPGKMVQLMFETPESRDQLVSGDVLINSFSIVQSGRSVRLLECR
jgi:hypothetical protein